MQKTEPIVLLTARNGGYINTSTHGLPYTNKMRKFLAVALTLLMTLGLAVTVNAEVLPTPSYRITLTEGLKDTDFSWEDLDDSASGIQIDVNVKLSSDARKVEVFDANGIGYLGHFSKGGPDGSYLKFKELKVAKYGKGIHVYVKAAYNSLSSYTGNRADKIAFKEFYTEGKELVYTLKFYDDNGNPVTGITGTNNLPQWRIMREVPIYEITLPSGLNDTNFSWTDVNTKKVGTQVNAQVRLTSDAKMVEVLATMGSSNRGQGYLGSFSKGGPDSGILSFKNLNVVPVVEGIHVYVTVDTNTLSNYTGNRMDKINFKNSYPAGKTLVYGLEFNDFNGNPLDITPGSNNLPSWRDLKEVRWEITLPAGLKDTDFSWVDYNQSLIGTQILTRVVLFANARRIEVFDANGVGYLGYFLKGGPDGSYLEFNNLKAVSVGQGIHVSASVAFIVFQIILVHAQIR